MKSLQIEAGDIVLSPSGRSQLVERDKKLKQDLRLWLSEPLGIGYTTPSFGTKLSDLMFGVNDEFSRQKVEIEVLRVVSLYKAWQTERLQQAQSIGMLSNWSKNEIISEILSVKAVRVLTSIVVEVALTTLAGSSISIGLQSNSSGIRIV